MTKQTLYKVIKIPLSKIKRSMKKETYIDENGEKQRRVVEPHVYDMGKYSYSKAEKNEEVVAIGDNLVFRKLRDIKGETRNPNEIYDYISNLDFRLEQLREMPTSTTVKKELKRVEEEKRNFLFIPDIVNVKVDNKEYYKDIALNYFSMNGIIYKRFLCGAGQMRRNTVTFINEKYYDVMIEMLMCGLDSVLKEITISKLSAYFALSFSSVLWVRTPRFCVIPDIETTLKDQNIDFIVKNDDGSKSVEPRIMDLVLNSCDGEGLIDPSFAELWSQDMGIGYNCCQFVIRAPFIKGNLLTFDFKKYLKEECGVATIKSIYGEEFNVDELDVILTESQFKMHGVYNSVENYMDAFNKYGLAFGVARYNKKKDEEMYLLNYQYIQNCGLDNDAIEKLIEPTIDWFRNICSGDDVYTYLYSIGCQNDDSTIDDVFDNCGSLHTKAIVQNSKMMKDGYVRYKIYNSIKESFRQAKIGRIWARGNYQFMLADPTPLLQNAVGLEPKGIIPSNNIYSRFWIDKDIGKIVAMRSPLVDRHELNLLNIDKSDNSGQWFKYLYSGIVYSAYDTSTIRHSDSD